MIQKITPVIIDINGIKLITVTITRMNPNERFPNWFKICLNVTVSEVLFLTISRIICDDRLDELVLRVGLDIGFAMGIKIVSSSNLGGLFWLCNVSPTQLTID